jgi:hypothetical protein
MLWLGVWQKAVAAALAPVILWEGTKTLRRGKDLCDFRYRLGNSA